MHQEDTNPEQDNNLTAQRQMPSMTHSQTHSIGQKAILIVGGIVVLMALIAVNGGFGTDTGAKDLEKNNRRHKIINHLGEAPQISALPQKIIAPPEEIIHTNQAIPPKPVYTDYRINQGKQKQEQTPEERKIASAVLGYSNKAAHNTHQTSSQRDANNESFQETSEDSFAQGFQSTQLEGAKASLIPDRNLFITKGTSIECVLETAMSSDVLGMTSCRITRDVYSTSGKIVLLERGTRIVGQYKGGLQQGQSRLFVLWNRAETPNGVIIDLDSGGTDALGRAGHEGFIDNHFYEQLGTSIIFGTKVDQTGTHIFLPFELMKSLETTEYSGKLLAKKATKLVDEKYIAIDSWWNNWYSYLALLALIIVLNLGLLNQCYFWILGAIGILFLFLGFYSQHLELANNYNVLLFNPALIALAVVLKNKKQLKLCTNLAYFNLGSLLVYLLILSNKVHLVIVLPLILTNLYLLIKIVLKNRKTVL